MATEAVVNTSQSEGFVGNLATPSNHLMISTPKPMKRGVICTPSPQASQAAPTTPIQTPRAPSVVTTPPPTKVRFQSPPKVREQADPLLRAIHSKSARRVRTALAKYKCDPNEDFVVDNIVTPAVCLAASLGEESVCHALLDAGADVQCQTGRGENTLHILLKAQEKYCRTAPPKTEWCTPRRLAFENDEMHSSPTKRARKDNGQTDLITRLTFAGTPYHSSDCRGMSPEHYAKRGNCFEALGVFDDHQSALVRQELHFARRDFAILHAITTDLSPLTSLTRYVSSFDHGDPTTNQNDPIIKIKEVSMTFEEMVLSCPDDIFEHVCKFVAGDDSMQKLRFEDRSPLRSPVRGRVSFD